MRIIRRLAAVGAIAGLLTGGAVTAHEDIDPETGTVHAWRVS